MIIPSDITRLYPFNHGEDTMKVAKFYSRGKSGGDKPLWKIELEQDRPNNRSIIKIYKNVYRKNMWLDVVKMDGYISDIKELPLLFKWVGIIE